MISFKLSYETAKKKLYNHEATNNLYLAFLTGLVFFFLLVIIMQRLTFANPLKLANFRNIDLNINLVSFIRAFIANLIYYVTCICLPWLYYAKDIKVPFVQTLASNEFIGTYIIIRIMLPTFVAVNIMKTYFTTFFYSHMSEGSLWWKRHLYSIENSIMAPNAMAEIYLFRLYNHFISIIISLVLLLLYSDVSFPFTPNEYLNPLVYNKENFISMKIVTTYLTLTIIYMLVGVADFYNYPKFSDSSQIWDCLFVLSDEKMKEINDEDDYSNDYKLLSSTLIKETLNQDIQSETYKDKMLKKENRLLVDIILNTDIYLTHVEEDALLEDVALGRDDDNPAKLKKAMIKQIN